MKNKIILALMFLCPFLHGCGGFEMIELPSLSMNQPKIADVDPSKGATVRPDSTIKVMFSREIDPETIDNATFAVVSSFDKDAPTKVIDDLDDGDIRGIDGEYLFSENNLCVTFKPTDPLAAGSVYGIVLLKKIKTADKLNLANVYVDYFAVEEGLEAGPSDEVDTGTGTAATEETGGETTDIAETPAVASVLINEVYYDAPDIDTNGDLFIELKGVSGGSIGGYKLLFVNGDDKNIYDTLVLPASAKIETDGLYVIADAKTGSTSSTNVIKWDFIANIDPQNGPDAVVLQNVGGAVVDAVCYGSLPAENQDICLNFADDAPSGSSIERNEEGSFVVNGAPLPGE